jgi:MFS family permease
LVQGGVTGSQAAAAALVAAAAPSGQVGVALGLVSTAVQVGNAVGPAVGGLTVASLGFRGSFILGGALLLVAGLMAVVWIDEPRSARLVRPRPAGGLWAGMLAALGWPGFRSLLLLQIGTQFVFSASVGLLPLYLQDLDRPMWLSAELASGLAITLTALLAALSMPFLGAWTDRRGPYGLLSLSLVGAALVLVVQALVPTVGLILALRALFGVWLAGVTATSSVLTKLAAPPGSEGAAYGAALQALWCWRLQQGETVSITAITDELVQLNRAETTGPNAKNAAVYRALQALQDELSRSLRGVFAKHRRFVLR